MKYELLSLSTRRMSFIPDDLSYFQTHFICKPMGKNWQLPPVSIAGKSYKAADFVQWMDKAPVISQRAKHVLSDLCDGLVEFLPFHSIKGAPYFAANVLCQDEGRPIYKSDQWSAVFVDERFGSIVRDHALTGVALADPSDEIGRRIVRGQSLHDYPGLAG